MTSAIFHSLSRWVSLLFGATMNWKARARDYLRVSPPTLATWAATGAL